MLESQFTVFQPDLFPDDIGGVGRKHIDVMKVRALRPWSFLDLTAPIRWG